MRRCLFPICLILLYVVVVVCIDKKMAERPRRVSVGLVPPVGVQRVLAGGFHQFVSAALVFKGLIYFGEASLENNSNIDYDGLRLLMENAVKLDPYNMDAYYFSQATLVWDLNLVEDANRLLIYGMKFRNWDFYLPLFVGFNYAYFLKDYKNAARYYKIAGDLSGNPMYIGLAGQYMAESGKIKLAIQYLSAMATITKNSAIKKNLLLRKKMFEDILNITKVTKKFFDKEGRYPQNVNELREKGYLEKVPAHPFGGRYVFSSDGKVRSKMH